MTGLAGLLLHAFWFFAPDGYLLARQLDGSPVAPALAKLSPAIESSWIVFHRRPDWAMAFYSPPEADLAMMELLAAEVLVEPERLLPRLRLPRIFLYAPYYSFGAASSTGDLVAVESMALDVAESYFHALLEAFLDREARHPESLYLAAARGRAGSVMSEVPEPQRLAAYLSAATDFASHLLSIAHEIDRAERRARSRGKDLCALLDPPRTLFALWAASVSTASYPGRYTVLSSGEGDGGGGIVRQMTTRGGLERRDKELVLEEVFSGHWTGDVGRDFGHLCR